MLVACIDFTKAYDMVDRGKMRWCLEQLGVNGRFLTCFSGGLCEELRCMKAGC